MKGTDRNVLFVVPLIGLLLVFYFMVLGPKREEASKLDKDIATIEGQISTAEQTAAFAEEARSEFPKYYGHLVSLGKAVPEQADSASFLVQLNSIAERSDISFDKIEVATGTTEATTAAPAPAAPAAPPAEGAPSPETTPASTDPTAQPTSPTPATETVAASLPIGATVGPAGLPTMPYTLEFTGGFFNVADFFDGVDGLVGLNGEEESVSANGRLLTIDGFVLKAPREDLTGQLILDASLSTTTFVTPPEQGLTGGATPGCPARDDVARRAHRPPRPDDAMNSEKIQKFGSRPGPRPPSARPAAGRRSCWPSGSWRSRW